MIIRVTPEQISQLWPSIRYGILQTMTPTVCIESKSIQNILAELISGNMQCWTVYEYKEDKTLIQGYIVTSIQEEAHTATKTLFIYSLFMYSLVENREEIFDTLLKYAKGKECKFIAGITDNQVVINIADKFGFKKQVYVVKEV